MRIYELDPIKDARWAHFSERHPDACVFHTVGWLRALWHTYRYEPVAFTTSAPNGELNNGIVFCRINSWLTGRRLVSLPFSDYCEPLCDSNESLNFLIRYLQTALGPQGCKYLELRPTSGNVGNVSGTNDLQPSARYFRHVLDLRPAVDELFQGLHRNSVQRRVQRAERAGLVEKCGRSEELLRDFFSLFVVTRRRHRVPPMPYSWFRHLIEFQGDALEIRLAYKDEIPIAGILTLRFKTIVLYKYGCSSARFNRFGATPWLLWRAIVAAKSRGATKFDLGRTEEDNVGLLEFKNHWVPQPIPLVYWRFPVDFSFDLAGSWQLKAAQLVFSCMPNSLLTFAGKVIYRHIG
jgi:hypothetical protein